MTNLQIRHKILLAFMLVLAPLGYLLYTLISNQNVVVDFAKAELDGNAYIRVLLDQQQMAYNGLRSAEWGTKAADAKAMVADVQKMDAAYGAAFLATDNAAKLEKALAAGATSDDSFAALRDVMARVADKSNLMLDPDLDSYYLMDGVVVRIPMLMDQVRTIANLALKGVDGAPLTDADRIALYVARGSLETTRGDVDLSFTTASNNGRDELVKANLMPTYNKLKPTLEAFSTLALQVADGKQPVAKKALLDAEHAAVAALGTMADTGAPELDRMLQSRLDGFAHDRVVQVSISVVLFLMCGFIVMFILHTGVVSPLSKISHVMEDLAGDKLDVEIPYGTKHDEVGLMARSIVVFKNNALARREMEAAERGAIQGRLERQKKLEERLSAFEGSVRNVLRSLERSAEAMIAASDMMATAANNTSSQSQNVANTTRETTSSIQGVAAAVEELSATTEDISSRATNSANVADQALRAANETEKAVTELSELALLINTVVETIDNIASQTNLLALNATIEAARAGEAGKGFAVVAGEVKALSGETSNATGEIADKIQKIQESVNKAHGKVEHIVTVIRDLTSASAAIQHNVEQQGAATGEISRSLQEVSMGAMAITNSIEQVSADASQAASASEHVASASNEVVTESERLRTELESFFADVRKLTQAA